MTDRAANPCFCATTPLLRDDAIALMDYGRMLLRLFTCRTLQMRHRLPVAKLQFLFSRPSRYPRLLSPGCAVPTAYGSSANAPGLSVLNPASPLCSLGTLQSGDTRGRGIIFCPAFMKCPQYFTWHLMDRRRRPSVEPGFRGASQPSLRAGARSATGRGEG